MHCFVHAPLLNWQRLVWDATVPSRAILGIVTCVEVRCLSSMFLFMCFFFMPSAPIIIGIMFTSMLHILNISISMSLYFDSFPTSFFRIFCSEGTEMSINKQIFFVQSFTGDWLWFLYWFRPTYLEWLSACRCLVPYLVVDYTTS